MTGQPDAARDIYQTLDHLFGSEVTDNDEVIAAIESLRAERDALDWKVRELSQQRLTPAEVAVRADLDAAQAKVDRVEALLVGLIPWDSTGRIAPDALRRALDGTSGQERGDDHG